MLNILKDDLYNRPSRSLLIAARYACLALGEHRPDWIEALANGDTEKLPAVVGVAKELIAADEPKIDDRGVPGQGGLLRAQKGQSLTEVALGLGVLALIAFLIIGLMQSPAGQEMQAAAEQGLSNIMADAAVAAPARDLGRSHAAKHGEEAITADQCFGKYGVYQQWTRPTDGYKANVCFLGTQFFIQIVDEAGGEVTKFQRKAARSLGDVGDYLKSSGYKR
jgi:hypothetical protein